MRVLLRDVFLGALPTSPGQRASAGASEGLEERLSESVTLGRAAWPSLEVDDAAFVAWIAGRVRPEGNFDEALAELRKADLYLACAAASGDAVAIRAFEAHAFGDLEGLWPSFQDRVGREDARQMLREKLFTRSSPSGEPKIVQFAGRGDIRGWVRIVAARMLSDLTDKAQRERPVEDAFFEKLGTGMDHELDRFKARYGAEFREAFRQAALTLAPRDKSLLRHAYVREASVVEIGVVYGVHGATAARWLASARQRLVRELKKAFAERLEVSSDELESVLRMIESTAHVTLERYFKELDDVPRDAKDG